MKTLPLARVVAAAKKAAGVNSKGRVDVGYRTDRTAPEGERFPYTADSRLWHNPDSEEGGLYDVTSLEKDDYKKGANLDLYVYDQYGELITNVCAIISEDQELLACFDSVTRTGLDWLCWWMEGTECPCEACKEFS